MSQNQSLLDAAIGLLSHGTLGLPEIAQVADLIAADARFNAWFATEGKRTLGDDAVLHVLDTYSDAAEACQGAIARYSSDLDASALSLVLARALQTIGAPRG